MILIVLTVLDDVLFFLFFSFYSKVEKTNLVFFSLYFQTKRKKRICSFGNIILCGTEFLSVENILWFFFFVFSFLLKKVHLTSGPSVDPLNVQNPICPHTHNELLLRAVYIFHNLFDNHVSGTIDNGKLYWRTARWVLYNKLSSKHLASLMSLC